MQVAGRLGTHLGPFFHSLMVGSCDGAPGSVVQAGGPCRLLRQLLPEEAVKEVAAILHVLPKLLPDVPVKAVCYSADFHEEDLFQEEPALWFEQHAILRIIVHRTSLTAIEGSK